MNRFKFRVWDKRKRSFSCPKNLGAWFIRQNGVLEHQQMSIGGLDYNDDPCYCSTNRPKSLEKFVVQQFTGIQDKNGKDIYEGDVISCDELDCSQPTNGKQPVLQSFPKALVEWNKSKLTFTYNPIKNGRALLHQMLCYAGNIKIIGNIFQNTELLAA